MAVPLTLYAESTWMSPWAFHALVALEEKNLSYKLEVVPLPIPPPQRDELAAKALIGKVPILVHGDVWISESLAISEYLAESFRAPDYPRCSPPRSPSVPARGRSCRCCGRACSRSARRARRPACSAARTPSR